MSTINDILTYIEGHKSWKVFNGWRITEKSHRKYISANYAAGLLFVHTAATNARDIDGIGIVEPLGDNRWFLTQLIADNESARIGLVEQFLARYPGAIIAGYDRRGTRRTVKRSDRLIKRMLSKMIYGKRS